MKLAIGNEMPETGAFVGLVNNEGKLFANNYRWEDGVLEILTTDGYVSVGVDVDTHFADVTVLGFMIGLTAANSITVEELAEAPAAVDAAVEAAAEEA